MWSWFRSSVRRLWLTWIKTNDTSPHPYTAIHWRRDTPTAYIQEIGAVRYPLVIWKLSDFLFGTAKTLSMSAISTRNEHHSENKFRKYFTNDQHLWCKIASNSPKKQHWNKTLLFANWGNTKHFVGTNNTTQLCHPLIIT